jgi:hypothetical protein
MNSSDRKTTFYLLTEEEADRLCNLAGTFIHAICEVVTAKRQTLDESDYDFYELSFYEQASELTVPRKPSSE